MIHKQIFSNTEKRVENKQGSRTVVWAADNKMVSWSLGHFNFHFCNPSMSPLIQLPAGLDKRRQVTGLRKKSFMEDIMF